MRLPLYQIDAFTKRRFAGNPAAICPLPKWLPDPTLLDIAAENNLAETAFFVAEPDGYRLRWFTPAVEVDLCGHATLAAALVLMDCLGFGGDQVTFQSHSGPLTVSRSGDLYTLDFPSRPGVEQAANDAITQAFGAAPQLILIARDTMCVFASAADVLALRPNMEALKALPTFGFIDLGQLVEADERIQRNPFIRRVAPGALVSKQLKRSDQVGPMPKNPGIWRVAFKD